MLSLMQGRDMMSDLEKYIGYIWEKKSKKLLLLSLQEEYLKENVREKRER
jgi:hypothetical protein